jgi:curved DNA-binding protein CbpA
VCPFCTPAPAPPPPAASPAAPDYYEILGIAHYSTATEIKQQYRRLAFMFHPDRNPGDRTAEEKFKRISEAYEVLSDPEKRRRYDRIGWTH